ncbi:MAG TPA: hypothetical protein VM901_00930 [Bdellovibrionota bacterium]|nr:hypothetical protein [Bdellovibrionota bacterium]
MFKRESEKSSFYQEIAQILPFLPRHFAKQKQTLDAAFDGYRLHQTLSPSALDLILMSYRYAHWFERVVKTFSSKKIKPAEMLDLWLLGFTALLTRENPPAFAIVSECVSLAKARYGAHTGGITNAFLRHIERELAKLREELRASPQIALPEWLRERWAGAMDLDRVAQNFVKRPERGVGGFGENLEYVRREWSPEIFRAQFQAMDPGSFDFCRWVSERLGTQDKNFFDACAAPGGKAIYMANHLSRSVGLGDVVLCESKSARMNPLKENWRRWELPETSSLFALHEWGAEVPPKAITARSWHFALVDLPCSGSGTLYTRPDVLYREWPADIASLEKIQSSILRDIRELKVPKLFVSICSVDPVEIANVSRALGAEPSFRSWESVNDDDGAREGIVGWYCGPALRPLQ